MRISISLSVAKTVYERQAYNVLMLLGDYGGLVGAIRVIFSFFLLRYSSALFQVSLIDEFKHEPTID